ncbi:unnamed protein product [Sphagnum tenellum]
MEEMTDGRIIDVDTIGVKLRLGGEEKHITWEALEDASQDNGELTEYYRSIRENALRAARYKRPVKIFYGEVGTNLFGFRVQTVSEEIIHPRHSLYGGDFKWIHRTECLDQWPILRWAKEEADEIALRLNKAPGNIVSPVRWPGDRSMQ